MTDQKAGQRISSVYALLVFVLALFAGRRLHQLGATGLPSQALRMRQAQVWLGLLSLASLRSPFVPDAYGFIGTLWLLTLVAADRRWRSYMWIVFAAAAVTVSVILDGGPIPTPVPSWIVALTLVVQVGVIAFNVAAVIGSRSRAAAPVSVAV